jgi:hypothetical protein
VTKTKRTTYKHIVRSVSSVKNFGKNENFVSDAQDVVFVHTVNVVGGNCLMVSFVMCFKGICTLK